MAEESSGETSVEVDAAKKTLKITGKKTAEIIAILSAVGLMWVGWVLYTHSTEAKAGTDRMQDGIERMVRSQRELTCLLGFPEKDREHKTEFCKRVSR